MLKLALPMLLAPSLAFAMVGGELTFRESDALCGQNTLIYCIDSALDWIRSVMNRFSE